ncbi:MAG: formamidopyrimidine-DNA glycosylase [Planctomycetes bacterium]|nr:formamidopyrimidine-DNA glycosylase [Planctomycetota bacterium]
MPELPDIRLYLDLLRPRLIGATLDSASVRGVSLLRTFDPPLDSAETARVTHLDRIGKRIVIAFDNEVRFIVHLMIAGRFRWSDAPAVAATGLPRGGGRIDQAALRFSRGTLTLTEAGTKKRASLHVVLGDAALAAFNPGGLDVFTCNERAFESAIKRENRTLKRALTDPSILDGIGNAYSDEILHAARLSPVTRTHALDASTCAGLLAAARETLESWTRTLRTEFDLNHDGTPLGPSNPGRFPRAGEITAFRLGFAVHGRYGRPCPACTTPVQRIMYAENECNYCPRCQTNGKLLADRAMSRLLKGDWPRTIEELEDSR